MKVACALKQPPMPIPKYDEIMLPLLKVLADDHLGLTWTGRVEQPQYLSCSGSGKFVIRR